MDMSFQDMPHNEGGETVPSSKPETAQGEAPTPAPDYAKTAAPGNRAGSGNRSKHYGYTCPVCGEPIVEPQPTEHTDEGLAHLICTVEIPPEEI